MNLEKLKDSARKFEQKEDWRRAIEAYLKALQQIESGAESTPDLSLYNRIGDLYLKINDTAAAVRSYERAVDLYADQGFFNNAIALCGKILRVNPGRTQTYLKLAQLHARKNVVIEAKRNLIEFLERMNALGQLDQAFQSVKEFADHFAGSQEIRLMLVELLRAASREDEAREQLEKMAGSSAAPPAAAPTGDAAARIDTSSQSADLSSRRGNLIFLDTGFATAAAPPADPPAPPPPLEGLERASDLESLPAESAGAAALEVEGLDIERNASPALDFVAAPLEGMEETSFAPELPDLELRDPGLADPELLEAELLQPAMLQPEMLQPEMLQPEMLQPEIEVDLTDAPPVEADLDFIAVDADTEREPDAGQPVASPSLAGLELRVLDDPEDPDRHRDLALALAASGEDERAVEELTLSLEGYERRADWPGAARVAERLLALAPDDIRHHQKRVELAYRMGEKAPLVDAYLALADALDRLGAGDKAIAVYARVQEHDPGNPRAAVALQRLSGPPHSPAGTAPRVRSIPAARPAVPEQPAASLPAIESPAPPVSAPAIAEQRSDVTDFVDLGAMVIDEGPRDTRMRVERSEPAHDDEQREFAEILEQFKRGIEANLDSEDYQAHYDLGVAFKEMGLLDEAIAEFQKALRAPESGARLRTSEALGAAFFEKAQYGISETVLRRAVTSLDGGDDTKIGVIYWLGRAAEAQGKTADAIASYERALAVDIRFMDLGERLQRLTAGRQS
ncbi:MAG: tetratricopeptide repeat protein [Gemmatimonadales bacterium]|nr:tetratricopeptide repeat protein [Gemmatimonadales bacterium]